MFQQQTPITYQSLSAHKAAQSNTHNENNYLLQASRGILNFIAYIRCSVDHSNVPALRAQIIEQIKVFERTITNYQYPIRIIISARYILCTAIDEAILSCSWGARSIWVQESLLSLFQKETYGGERFYIILEHMLRDVKNNIDCIELVYFVLSLGFEGKLYGDEHITSRESIRNRVFAMIRELRIKPNKLLSPNWKIRQLPRSSKDCLRKVRKTALISLAILILISLFYQYKSYKTSSSTLHRLSKIANVSPITIFSQVINRPTIRRKHSDRKEVQQ